MTWKVKGYSPNPQTFLSGSPLPVTVGLSLIFPSHLSQINYCRTI